MTCTTQEFFEKHAEEYLAHAKDPDLSGIVHDFYIFSKLANYAVPHRDLLVDARYEEIYFSVDPEQVYRDLPEEEMIRLIRCGLRYSAEHECFCMFV